MAEPLDELKYDLIELGLEIEYFHASEDKQKVRDQVFGIVKNHLNHIQIDSLIVNKRKTGPTLRSETQFYPRMLGYLLNYPLTSQIFGKYRVEDFDEVIIVTDAIPVKRKKAAVEKAIKSFLKSLPRKTQYRIMHHSSKSSMELQVADYCNWAIFRKWERNDTRSYDLIKGGIKSEFDIFRTGTRHYY